MNYLYDVSQEYYNWYYNLEKIILKPTQKFFEGNTLICILQNNGKDYHIPHGYKLKRIDYIPLSKDSYEYDFSINYHSFNISPCEYTDFKINGKKSYKYLDILSYPNNYYVTIQFCYKHLNPLPKLPLPHIPNFYINLVLEKLPYHQNKNNIVKNITLNTYVYHNLKLPLEIEEKMFHNQKKDVGICFSGGGSRSASATIGYLRALKMMNVLDKIKYISVVSGSSWILVPFTYLKKDWDEDKFIGLDKFGDLNKVLNINDVNYTDEKYIGNSLISYANNSSLIKYIFESFRYLGHGEKTRIWPYMLGKMMLEPYDLLNTDFYSLNKNIIELFQEKPLSLDKSLEFKLPYNNDRPFLFVNTNIVKPNKYGSLTNTDFSLVNFTPLYSGTLSSLNDSKNGEMYGNGYINSYGFHSKEFYNLNKIDENLSLAQVEIPASQSLNNIQRFNLFDMVGSSSAAYGIIMDYLDFPDINPCYRLCDQKNNKMKSFDTVDGGTLDNQGILVMLQRKVKNIVLFVNTNDKICVEGNDDQMTKSIDITFRQYFLGDHDIDKIKYFNYFEYINDLKVFDEGEELWEEVLKQFRHNILINDSCFVELNNVKVMKNDNYQIEEYILDKLLIVYLYEQKDWLDSRLNDNVRKLLEENYRDFPYINTIFPHNGWLQKELLAMDAAELNLLGDLCCWNLMKNKIINEKFMKLFDL